MSTRITIPRKLDRLGVAVPAALAAVFDLDASLDELRNARPTDDLRADLLAGRLDDPVRLRTRIQKTADALAGRDYATQIITDLDQALEHRARIALRETADEITTGMRGPFERAVATLMAGLDALGPDPSPQLGDKSPMLARIYGEWRAALDDCRAIRAVVNDIDSSVERVGWFTDRPGDLDQAREAFRQGEVWGLVRAGVAVRLNTRAEALALIAGAERTQSEAAAAEEAARKAKAKAEVKPYMDAWREHARKVGAENVRRDAEREAALAKADTR